MAHVSKKKLSKKVKDRIDTQLIDVLTKRWARNAKTSVLYEIITDTEKAMFAKRVAIIAMIEAGCSTYEIALALGVGTATVSKFRKGFERGHFENIARILGSKNERGNLYDTMELLVCVGIPSRGARRSRMFRKLHATEQKQKRRRANPNR